jgi:hypothetical protein
LPFRPVRRLSGSLADSAEEDIPISAEEDIPMRFAAVASTAILALAPISAHAENWTIVYLQPDRAQSESWYEVAELPSYVFMPGTKIAVAYSRPVGGYLAAGAAAANSSVDLDCWQVAGPVYVGGSDPNGLDGDGDGIGCE